jgi:hypothetical protein
MKPSRPSPYHTFDSRGRQCQETWAALVDWFARTLSRSFFADGPRKSSTNGPMTPSSLRCCTQVSHCDTVIVCNVGKRDHEKPGTVNLRAVLPKTRLLSCTIATYKLGRTARITAPLESTSGSTDTHTNLTHSLSKRCASPTPSDFPHPPVDKTPSARSSFAFKAARMT